MCDVSFILIDCWWCRWLRYTFDIHYTVLLSNTLLIGWSYGINYGTNGPIRFLHFTKYIIIEWRISFASKPRIQRSCVSLYTDKRLQINTRIPLHISTISNGAVAESAEEQADPSPPHTHPPMNHIYSPNRKRLDVEKIPTILLEQPRPVINKVMFTTSITQVHRLMIYSLYLKCNQPNSLTFIHLILSTLPSTFTWL